MARRRWFAAVVAVLAFACAGVAFGWFAGFDKALRDWRFELASRPVSGDIVLLGVDQAALDTLGARPWSRATEARIIDSLLQAGAFEIILDADLTSSTTPLDDSELERALIEARGRVLLGVHGEPGVPLPMPRFSAIAEAVSVGITPGRDQPLRTYPGLSLHDGVVVRSLAAALAGTPASADTPFLIDYSFDALSIPRVPLSAVLAAPPNSPIAGKQVILDAGGDAESVMAVPRFGVLGELEIEIVAAETLRAGRAITDGGPLGPLVLVLALGAMLVFYGEKLAFGQMMLGSLGIALGIEALAFLLHANFAIALSTPVVHIGQAGFMLAAIALELMRKTDQHLVATRERDTMRGMLDRVITDNFDGVVVVNDEGTIIAASRLAENLLGTGLSLAGQHITRALPRPIEQQLATALAQAQAKGAWAATPAELSLEGPDGSRRVIEYAITMSQMLGERGMDRVRRRHIACLTFRDITDRRANEQRLTYFANHDSLTGALSRPRLVDEINLLLTTDAQRAQGLTVFILDLARFRMVNDTLGHSLGDEVLRQVVVRLKAAEALHVTRLGGDSFALIRPGSMDDEAAFYCDSLIERVSLPYELGEHRAVIGASIGITDTAISGYEPELLLSRADMALSAAKSQPGNGYAVFVPEMDDRLKEKQDMEVALRQALQRGEFSVLYQPQVMLGTGALIGVEALVRWNHPELGAVPPSKFIPAAEESGVILELGRFVLREACRTVAAWPSIVRLAVNVSPIQFELGNVIADVTHTLEESGLAPSRLDLEITEGIFVTNAQNITSALQSLRAMGIGIALDDFGTGYSSLSYLGRLPVDKIKIDQSFVHGLPADAEATAIIRAVMTLSETLGKVVVAEGIETKDQAWMLKLMGCAIGQGYHFGRPMTATELEETLARSGPAKWAEAV